jgi:hypothetical protein
VNIGPVTRVATLIWDARFSLVTALLAGFGRAAAEVGAIIIVGGNIDGFTRTMTTAIALETSKGDLSLAVGLGMVLIAIVAAVNALAWAARRAGERLRDEHAGAYCRSTDHIRRRQHLCGRGHDPRPHHTDLSPGTPTVLIGPNGSGKTTLLRAAMGLTTPSHGRITWGGREGVPPTRRAILFQRPAMLRRSAGGNIRFALRAAGVPRLGRHGRIGELLELVGLERLTDRPARRLSGSNSSASRSRVRSPAAPPCCSLTSRPRASIPPPPRQ